MKIKEAKLFTKIRISFTVLSNITSQNNHDSLSRGIGC